MRPPRLLALLIVLAALLAAGAWWFVRQQPAAVASEPTDSAEIEAHKSGELTILVGKQVEAALEINTTAERKAEPAIAESGPNAKQHPIALADSTRIHGRVVRGALELPVAGLEIVCTQDLAPMRIETPFVIDDDGKRMFGMPANMPKGSRSSCTSAADGSFEFKGLDRASLYTLSARGNGWVLVAPLASIAPSEEPRVLAVQRIYVARVLALDEDGKPPASECQYLRYVRIAGPGECDSVPLADSPPQNFRDLKLPAANEAATPSEGRSYTFASDCDAARLGPFRGLRAPGLRVLGLSRGAAGGGDGPAHAARRGGHGLAARAPGLRVQGIELRAPARGPRRARARRTGRADARVRAHGSRARTDLPRHPRRHVARTRLRQARRLVSSATRRAAARDRRCCTCRSEISARSAGSCAGRPSSSRARRCRSTGARTERRRACSCGCRS